jgi:hypothetical protein
MNIWKSRSSHFVIFDLFSPFITSAKRLDLTNAKAGFINVAGTRPGCLTA